MIKFTPRKLETDAILLCPESPRLARPKTSGARVKVGMVEFRVLHSKTRPVAPVTRLLFWTMRATVTLTLLIIIVRPHKGRLTAPVEEVCVIITLLFRLSVR